MKLISVTRFWTHLYYDIKMGIRNLIVYFPAVVKMRTWDAEHSMDLLSFALNDLKKSLIRNDITESSKDDAKDISRVIELIKNLNEDNYNERCGFDFNYDIIWIDVEDKKNSEFELKEMTSTETPEQKENNFRAIKEGMILREKEKDELFELLKKYDTWWD